MSRRRRRAGDAERDPGARKESAPAREEPASAGKEPASARKGPAGARKGPAGAREKPASARKGPAGAREKPARARKGPATARRGVPSGWRLGVQIGLLVAVFAAVTAIAELAGAANLGVALGVGQVAFALAVAYLLLRR